MPGRRKSFCQVCDILSEWKNFGILELRKFERLGGTYILQILAKTLRVKSVYRPPHSLKRLSPGAVHCNMLQLFSFKRPNQEALRKHRLQGPSQTILWAQNEPLSGIVPCTQLYRWQSVTSKDRSITLFSRLSPSLSQTSNVPSKEQRLANSRDGQRYVWVAWG